jgi:hypothetical protein
VGLQKEVTRFTIPYTTEEFGKIVYNNKEYIYNGGWSYL